MSTGVVISLPLTVNSRLWEMPSTVAVTVAVLLFAEEIPPAPNADDLVDGLMSYINSAMFEPAGTMSVSLTIVLSPSVSSVLSAERLNFSISRL